MPERPLSQTRETQRLGDQNRELNFRREIIRKAAGLFRNGDDLSAYGAKQLSWVLEVFQPSLHGRLPIIIRRSVCFQKINRCPSGLSLSGPVSGIDRPLGVGRCSIDPALRLTRWPGQSQSAS
jgi:hypothetical protein